MSYQYKNLSISKLSIIGAGQIGPDIALHFAKVFAKHDVKLVIVDIAEEAIEKAKAKIEKKIAKGVETGAFKPEMAETMKTSITYTTDYQAISGSEIVLEAATEDENIKDAIFKQVESICDDKCLFFSNSSHMQPEVIFKNIKDQSRSLVIHYFFPAERNPVVELIPSDKTDKELVETLLGFYESIGKIPIKVKSSYGYAIDPIFEGLCQTAILCLEKGYGTVKEIDAVAMKTLGLGVGPFTALTLTGGNPITNHGLDEMNKLLMPWFRSPNALKEAVKNNTGWDIASRDEKVEVVSEKEEALTKQFLGAYFGLASYILDLGICDISDLNMACEIALVIKAPFTMMNKMEVRKALSAVQAFCNEHYGFEVPGSLKVAAKTGKWEISNVIKKRKNNIAVLTIKRPRVLNALNNTVLNELRKHFEEIENDSSIIGTVLTGFGNKAFVSGADIKELAQCKTPEEGYQSSKNFHSVLNYIENLKKPVVCAYNGFAFGGGNELAMACTLRICKKNMPVVVCQPEVNLGFIPGAGGTQRLPRLIGLDKAGEILRTGRTVSSKEAAEIGLVHKEAEGELIEEAVNLIRQVANGEIDIKQLQEVPLAGNGGVPEINIGHLSKKIDGILTKAIYEGAKMSLEEGLELEAKLFGECINTEDMKIGLETFMKEGARAKAEFVHR
ncbi:MAG: 3-hydroxyacyl-CoA dehydrogenase/enoyl-CoA hydratase family protein [Cytophagales bacterium]|nr:3-hydroxyacyl-CoA dehydrogenase/enoyl-CoA hydratase family protein [Cytophagales bacterium]